MSLLKRIAIPLQLRITDALTGWSVVAEARCGRWLALREADRRLISEYHTLDDLVAGLGEDAKNANIMWQGAQIGTYYQDKTFVHLWDRTGQIIRECDDSPLEAWFAGYRGAEPLARFNWRPNGAHMRVLEGYILEVPQRCACMRREYDEIL